MNIVRNERKKLNITQKNLAIKCNVKQSYISQIESGKKIPSIRLIMDLSKELNICPILILKEYVNSKCEKCTIKNSCNI